MFDSFDKLKDNYYTTMKIFEKDEKINFVDDNNVFVGFDNYSNCCEDFGWSITKAFPTSLNQKEENLDLDGYQFDTEYFEQDIPGAYDDDGGAVVFRLTKGNDEIFLALWNIHNGYYCHGFYMIKGDLKIQDGSL